MPINTYSCARSNNNNNNLLGKLFLIIFFRSKVAHLVRKRCCTRCNDSSDFYYWIRAKEWHRPFLFASSATTASSGPQIVVCSSDSTYKIQINNPTASNFYSSLGGYFFLIWHNNSIDVIFLPTFFFYLRGSYNIPPSLQLYCISETATCNQLLAINKLIAPPALIKILVLTGNGCQAANQRPAVTAVTSRPSRCPRVITDRYEYYVQEVSTSQPSY